MSTPLGKIHGISPVCYRPLGRFPGFLKSITNMYALSNGFLTNLFMQHIRNKINLLFSIKDVHGKSNAIEPSLVCGPNANIISVKKHLRKRNPFNIVG
jgi:hypothetical protein